MPATLFCYSQALLILYPPILNLVDGSFDFRHPGWLLTFLYSFGDFRLRFIFRSLFSFFFFFLFFFSHLSFRFFDGLPTDETARCSIILLISTFCYLSYRSCIFFPAHQTTHRSTSRLFELSLSAVEPAVGWPCGATSDSIDASEAGPLCTCSGS